ncbi:MAG: hypothetical protein ACTSVI_15150 [Promethearchaeota archaeon]
MVLWKNISSEIKFNQETIDKVLLETQFLAKYLDKIPIYLICEKDMDMLYMKMDKYNGIDRKCLEKYRRYHQDVRDNLNDRHQHRDVYYEEKLRKFIYNYRKKFKDNHGKMDRETYIKNFLEMKIRRDKSSSSIILGNLKECIKKIKNFTRALGVYVSEGPEERDHVITILKWGKLKDDIILPAIFLCPERIRNCANELNYPENFLTVFITVLNHELTHAALDRFAHLSRRTYSIEPIIEKFIQESLCNATAFLLTPDDKKHIIAKLIREQPVEYQGYTFWTSIFNLLDIKKYISWFGRESIPMRILINVLFIRPIETVRYKDLFFQHLNPCIIENVWFSERIDTSFNHKNDRINISRFKMDLLSGIAGGSLFPNFLNDLMNRYWFWIGIGIISDVIA